MVEVVVVAIVAVEEDRRRREAFHYNRVASLSTVSVLGIPMVFARTSVRGCLIKIAQLELRNKNLEGRENYKLMRRTDAWGDRKKRRKRKKEGEEYRLGISQRDPMEDLSE